MDMNSSMATSAAIFSPRTRPQSAVALLTDKDKRASLKEKDQHGLYKCPYRPQSGVSRETLRNQFGKVWVLRNGGKYPSINQLL